MDFLLSTTVECYGLCAGIIAYLLHYPGKILVTTPGMPSYFQRPILSVQFRGHINKSLSLQGLAWLGPVIDVLVKWYMFYYYWGLTVVFTPSQSYHLSNAILLDSPSGTSMEFYELSPLGTYFINFNSLFVLLVISIHIIVKANTSCYLSTFEQIWSFAPIIGSYAGVYDLLLSAHVYHHSYYCWLLLKG